MADPDLTRHIATLQIRATGAMAGRLAALMLLTGAAQGIILAG